jgi:hypothetical protein
MADSAETKEALVALQAAVTVLINGTSLLQAGGGPGKAVEAAIEALPSTRAVKPEQLAHLNAFLRDSKCMPQSLTVQGILADMYATFAADLESMTFAEANANKDYESLMATKAEELKLLQPKKSKKEGLKAEEELRDKVEKCGLHADLHQLWVGG